MSNLNLFYSKLSCFSVVFFCYASQASPLFFLTSSCIFPSPLPLSFSLHPYHDRFIILSPFFFNVLLLLLYLDCLKHNTEADSVRRVFYFMLFVWVSVLSRLWVWFIFPSLFLLRGTKFECRPRHPFNSNCSIFCSQYIKSLHQASDCDFYWGRKQFHPRRQPTYDWSWLVFPQYLWTCSACKIYRNTFFSSPNVILISKALRTSNFSLSFYLTLNVSRRLFIVVN
jgi:hypothetical protein